MKVSWPFFLLLIALFGLSQTSYAQLRKKKRIQLVHANSLEYDERQGTKAKRLIGAVHLVHENTQLFSDSAYLYSKENKMEAYGHVRIKPARGGVIYADSLDYDGNTKVAKLRGEIKMIDKDITLYTHFLDYNLETDVAYYYNGGRIVNHKDNYTLTSTKGSYNPNAKKFFFKDSVHVKHPDYEIDSDTMQYDAGIDKVFFYGPSEIKQKNAVIYCQAGWHDSKTEKSLFKKKAVIHQDEQVLSGDSILYDQKTGSGESFGHVTLEDTVEKVFIEGKYAFHNAKDSISFVTGNAVMTQFYSNDTLYLHADTLFSLYDSITGNRVLKAFHHARFLKSDMQGSADSMIYAKADSLIRMYRKPIIWSGNNQMSAEHIDIYTYSGEIKRMDFKRNGLIISQEDDEKYNQIKGDKMISFFKENKLKTVQVSEQGETIYYAKEDDGVLIGVNVANCDSMIIFVDSSKVRSISFYRPVQATLYPVEEVVHTTLRVPNFQWIADNRRPRKKEDLFHYE